MIATCERVGLEKVYWYVTLSKGYDLLVFRQGNESVIFLFTHSNNGSRNLPNRHSNGQHFQQSLDQLVLVANSARGQLNRKNEYLPVPGHVPENLVSRDNLGRPVQRQPAHPSHLSVCVFFLPIHSGHQVRWTYQPGSHRRKVTQDLICHLPSFCGACLNFSREKDSAIRFPRRP